MNEVLKSENSSRKILVPQFLNKSSSLFVLSLYFIFVSGINLHSQERYWIFFKDKEGVVFDPINYLDEKTIVRREILGLPILDSTDFPVNSHYLRQVLQITGNIKATTRWFNGVSVDVNEKQLNELLELEFVSGFEPVKKIPFTATSIVNGEFDDDKNFLLKNQLESMGGRILTDNGLSGKNIRVAIFDGGFKNADILPEFKHLWENEQIIATYDFVRNEENVFHAMNHGTKVLACIAGKTGDKNIGLATGAEFLLARTEVWSEKFSEEENWLRAMEWADKNGADIVNSSLGYTYQRYFARDMNGKNSLVARAANMGARKGILVINSMGNDGDKPWEFVSTPADADSVLAVGAIDPYKGYHASYSSYGPTSDMRIKPNVVAFGEVITTSSRGGTRKSYGTSFAAPLVTGFAACILELNNHLPAMKLFDEIEKSGHLYPYYDYANGYGIPQAGYFFNDKPSQDTTFVLEVMNDSLLVKVIDSENRSPSGLLYYHIENSKGFLSYYAVIGVKQQIPFKISLSTLKPSDTVRVHYKGFTRKFFRYD